MKYVTSLLFVACFIKAAILQSQNKVAQTANAEMLSLYYGIGRYLSEQTLQMNWGSKVIETISLQLQKEMPGLRGFSASAIKRMRTFYTEWSMIENRPPAVDEICDDGINTSVLTIRPLLVGELDAHDFMSISFTHHSEILAKTDTLEERIFYIRQTARNHWSKDRLMENLKSDLFHHQSRMSDNNLEASRLIIFSR